jgi:UDP-glucose 4-epimerase
VIILSWRSAEQQPTRVVALFGAGLIGRAILASITRSINPAVRNFPFSWVSAEARQREAEAAINWIAQIAQAHDIQFDCIWAAGRSGFSADDADVDHELAAYADVIAFALRAGQLADPTSRRFHLISSAGGLFEGQRYVDHQSQPSPHRPYGLGKLAQERRLQDVSDRLPSFIYRPSSVFGYAAGGRIGLIAALIRDALHRRTSTIFGDWNTIRDYVFADDIGRYVGEIVVDRLQLPEIHLLASGKPASIGEVVSRVERSLQRRISVRFRPSTVNSSHNSFRPSALPSGWRPTPFETAVHATCLRVMEEFVPSRL